MELLFFFRLFEARIYPLQVFQFIALMYLRARDLQTKKALWQRLKTIILKEKEHSFE
jgi:hypothetical protein